MDTFIFPPPHPHFLARPPGLSSLITCFAHSFIFVCASKLYLMCAKYHINGVFLFVLLLCESFHTTLCRCVRTLFAFFVTCVNKSINGSVKRINKLPGYRILPYEEESDTLHRTLHKIINFHSNSRKKGEPLP